MEVYPIMIDGALAGKMRVERQGGRTVFDAECRMLPGLVRISVYGGGREGYLGVLAPADGKLRLRRVLSRLQLRDFPAEIDSVARAGLKQSAQETEEETEEETEAETEEETATETAAAANAEAEAEALAESEAKAGSITAVETAVEPAVETKAKAIAGTAKELAVETKAKAIAETAKEPAVETAAEAIAETAKEPAVETAAEVIAETATKSAVETEAKAIAEMETEPSMEAAVEPTEETAVMSGSTRAGASDAGLAWYASPDGALVCFDGRQTLIALPSGDARIPQDIPGDAREIEGRQYLVFRTKDGKMVR